MNKAAWHLVSTIPNLCKSIINQLLYNAAVTALLKDLELNQSNPVVLCLVKNAVVSRSMKSLLISWHKNQLDPTPLADALANLRCTASVAETVVRELSPLVSIQPLNSPCGLVYRMKMSKDGGQSDGKTSSMKLEIVPNAITAITRKMSTNVITASFHPDVEVMAMQMVAHGASTELIQHVVCDLKSAATRYTAAGDGAETIIRQAASHIAEKTRRGFPTFMVVTHKSMPSVSGLMVHCIHTNPCSALKQVGTIEFGAPLRTIPVYLDVLSNENNILMGYRSAVSDVDAGYVFSPYKLFDSSVVVIHPETFQPVKYAMARFGTSSLGSGSTSFTDGNYYALIEMDDNEQR